MKKRSLRIAQQLFNHILRLFSIHDNRIDHVLPRIVSAEHAPLPEVRREFMSRGVLFAWLFVNEDGPGLGVGMTRLDRGEGKQDHSFARLSPAQAMPAGITSRRIDIDDGVIRRASDALPVARRRRPPWAVEQCGRLNLSCVHPKTPQSPSRIDAFQAANSAATPFSRHSEVGAAINSIRFAAILKLTPYDPQRDYEADPL